MIAPDDLRSLSDNQLTALCKRNAVEELLHRTSCLGGLLAGCGVPVSIMVFAVIFARLQDWFPLYLLATMAFPFGFLIFSLFEFLARFRCRRFLQELESRAGWRPLEEYVRPLQNAIASEEIVMVLCGFGLPHGGCWWVCVRLKGKSGNVEARFGPVGHPISEVDFGSGENVLAFFRIVRAELSAQEAETLVSLAEQIHQPEIEVRSMVKDGFPVRCAVIHGESKRVSTISCNLAGIPDSQDTSPHIRLAQAVFAAGRALIDEQAIYGATHFDTGEIEIGEV